MCRFSCAPRGAPFRIGAPSQDANGILVIPVVQDSREHVAARRGGKGIEEAADLDASPVAQAGGGDGLFGAGHLTGWSTSVPRRSSWARRMVISKLALPPPTSTT